jgi:hypothetical protein
MAGPEVSSSEAQELERVRVLVGVAASFGTGIPVAEAIELLEEGAPGSSDELSRWIGRHPGVAREMGGSLVLPGLEWDQEEDASREALGKRYLEYSRDLFAGPLAPVSRWIATAATTGSTAFQRPRPGDDLDLFVVVHQGALWVFLAWSYLAIRLTPRGKGTEAPPRVCLNLVLDEPSALEEFVRPRGLLVAREILSAQVLQGEPYFRHLVRQASWMRAWLPRKYRRSAEGESGAGKTRVPRPLRLLNALLFPPLAAYLQLVGIWRNHRYRKYREGEGAFRTLTLPGRLQFASEAFQRLTTLYQPGTESPRGSAASGHGPAPGPSGPKGRGPSPAPPPGRAG